VSPLDSFGSSPDSFTASQDSSVHSPDFFLDSIDSFVSLTGSFVHPQFTQFIRASVLGRFASAHHLSVETLRCPQSAGPFCPSFDPPHPFIELLIHSSGSSLHQSLPLSPIQLIASSIKRSLDFFIDPSILQSARLFVYQSIRPSDLAPTRPFVCPSIPPSLSIFINHSDRPLSVHSLIRSPLNRPIRLSAQLFR
jgi:hypothetical protein